MELSQQGLRERIVQVEKAPGVPFDHGRFELILESSDGTPPSLEAVGAEKTNAPDVNRIPMSGNTLVQIGSTRKRRGQKPAKPASEVRSKDLILCRGCSRHVFEGTEICPYCRGNVSSLAKAYDKDLREARKAYALLLKLFQPAEHASG